MTLRRQPSGCHRRRQLFHQLHFHCFLMAEACFVLGCKARRDDTVSFHLLPNDLKVREKWVQFIWKGRHVPVPLPEKALVCSSHFPEYCFENFTRKKMGFASRLLLKPDAVPSIYPGDTASQGTDAFRVLTSVRHAASQTDGPELKSVSTQLSAKTLQHFRSKATQARVLSRDCGVSTVTFPLNSPLLLLQPTTVQRPSKRPRLSLTEEEEEEEEEEPSECSSSTKVHKPEDST